MSGLSVIVPCFNEEEGIPHLEDHLLRLESLFDSTNRKLELILVDDGSSDRTAELLSALAQRLQNAVAISHEVNKGIGEALKTGIGHCTRPWVAAIDSDCTYHPSDLLPMLLMAEDGADVVVGSPYAPQGKVDGVPLWALILSRGCSYLYRMVVGANVYTFTSMFRVYRREKLLEAEFHARGFLSMAELLVDMIMTGSTVVDYPTTLRNRQFGRSKRQVAGLVEAHLELVWRVFKHRTGLQRYPRWMA